MEFKVSPLPPIVSVLLVQFCFELDQSNSPTTQQQRGLVFAEQGTEFSLFTLTFSLLKSYAIFPSSPMGNTELWGEKIF